MASKMASRNWNCFILLNGLPSASNAKRSLPAIFFTREFSSIGISTSGFASEKLSTEPFENIISPIASGFFMRGEISSLIDLRNISWMSVLMSFQMASSSSWTATPASSNCLPNDAIQSCLSQASTSSFVR